MAVQDLLDDLKNVLYVDRVYSALQILGARRHDARHAVELSFTELRIFSQNGEDGVLDALLGAIGDFESYFVEFGVGDGWSCNCRLLAEVRGWRGLFMESEARDHALLSERYVHNARVACANEIVSSLNINELFSMYGVPESFGVLSVDIDGQDYWAWKALDERYRPDVVVIEFNAALDPLDSLVEVEGMEPGSPLGHTWGASLKALSDLGRVKGYRLVHVEMAGVNLFFVREETIARRNLVLQGVTVGRSPNYGLRGRSHPESVLYGDSRRNDRPQVRRKTDRNDG